MDRQLVGQSSCAPQPVRSRKELYDVRSETLIIGDICCYGHVRFGVSNGYVKYLVFVDSTQRAIMIK